VILPATAAGLAAVALPVLALAAEAAPPDARAVRSKTYRVAVGGRPVFTTQFRNVHYASFTIVGSAEVEVTAAARIESFDVSPHAARISARARGSSLKLRLDRPRHLVVTVDGGEKLFLFADAPEVGAPRPGAPGVTSIADFGVDATGGRVETERIQRAVDKVAAARGVLYFPPGVYLTGTISLKSNLSLYLSEGSRLLGSTNLDDYPADPGFDEANLRYDNDLWNRMGRVDVAYRRLILIENARNVRVAGRGIIDGQGKQLRHRKNIMFIMVRGSSDVSVDDLLLLDSPLYNAHVLASDRVAFRSVKIVSDQSVVNTDGIDPDSSRDVRIERCFFFTADDCISPKTSKQSGLTGDLERLTVRGCVFLSRTSATKIGNETFGGWMRDILFEDNDVLEADRAFTISCLDGNGYENIRYIDNRIETLLPLRLQFPVHVHSRRRRADGPAGRIHNVLFKNLIVEKEYPNPSRLAGLDAKNDVRGVRFVNYVVAGRVRLDAKDARVDIGPFVSEVTFSGPP
jgi:hypothetical protein